MRGTPKDDPMMTRRDWLLLVVITLLAAALRFYQIGVVPPGPQFDEAFNMIDAGQVLDGNRPLFLPANGGREVLYTYLQAAAGALGGVNIFTQRMVSALAGTLTVAALYLLVRRLFRRNGAWLAPLTALVLAVSYWHIHFSHYGIRVILMPLIFCGVFGAFWVGMHGGSRRARLAALIVGGALAGLGVWANPTGRFVPFVVAPYVLWLLWRYPDRRRLRLDSPIGGALLFGGVAFVVFLPLGLEFWRHPEFFLGHASEVSVFAARVAGESSPWAVLASNILHVLGMFSFVGDLEWAHGIANRPVFDWFIAIPFYIGVVVWVLRVVRPRPVADVRGGDPLTDVRGSDGERDALVLMALWGIVMLAPSVLSEAAPNYSRTLPAIPAISLAAGLGLTWIATQPRLRPGWGPALAGLLLVASAGVTFYDYFVRFPSYREVYYVFDADKVDALDWLKARAGANRIYLSPLWSEHATVTALRSSNIRSLDSRETVVLPPPGTGAIYAFPAEQRGYAEDVADLWGVEAVTINDRYARPLLEVVQLDAAQAAQWPAALALQPMLAARFDDGPSLIGLRAGESGSDLWLYWQAEQSTIRDLTAFVHLIDSRNQRVGQADRAPGDGTFRTPWWKPGERVAQHFAPEITDLCAGGETVQVVTGWYEYLADGRRRPRAGGAGDSAFAGELTLPWRSAPPDQMNIPIPVDTTLTDSLTLRGYGVEGEAFLGAPLTLDLFFSSENSNDGAMPLDLILTATAQPTATTTLWSGTLAPGADWRAGELLCRRLLVEIPADLAAAGDFRLELASGAARAPVGVLTVQASNRRFDLPSAPPMTPVDALFGGQMRLAAYETGARGASLGVTLAWQALTRPAVDTTVFVHLLDTNGEIVAQSDKAPGVEQPSSQWVAGEVVLDTHALALPPDLPPGEYGLRVGVYDALTQERLAVVDAGGQPVADSAVRLGTVRLPLSPSEP